MVSTPPFHCHRELTSVSSLLLFSLHLQNVSINVHRCIVIVPNRQVHNPPGPIVRHPPLLSSRILTFALFTAVFVFQFVSSTSAMPLHFSVAFHVAYPHVSLPGRQPPAASTSAYLPSVLSSHPIFLFTSIDLEKAAYLSSEPFSSIAGLTDLLSVPLVARAEPTYCFGLPPVNFLPSFPLYIFPRIMMKRRTRCYVLALLSAALVGLCASASAWASR